MASSQQNSERSPSSRNNAALGMIGGTFVGIMAFTTPFVFMQLRSSLPYMATPRQKVEKALKFISNRTRESAASPMGSVNLTHTKQSLGKNNVKLNFVDLGSGDGTAILAAASLGWKATGLELNPTLWFVSSIRRLFSTNTIRSNSRLIMGDMFESKKAKKALESANCVMIFGVNSLMPKIADLVQRECQTGCFLMSYRFWVPLMDGKAADERDKDADDKRNALMANGKLFKSGINASLIYDEDEMRIYELNDNKTTK